MEGQLHRGVRTSARRCFNDIQKVIPAGTAHPAPRRSKRRSKHIHLHVEMVGVVEKKVCCHQRQLEAPA
jgi:hypothetical protein